MVRPIVSDEVVIPRLIMPKTPRHFSSGNLTAGRSVVGSFDAVPLYMGGQTVEMCGFWMMWSGASTQEGGVS
jgi:hypothetical protein